MSGLAEGVRLWVREILIVLFLAGVLEMLLPETDTKRFARVAIGFFVVLAVGRPLLGFIGCGAPLDRGLAGLGTWDLGTAPAGSTSSVADPLRLGSEFRDASRERALAAARAALETQVVALAERDPEVAEAEAGVALLSDPSSSSYGALETVTLKVWMVRSAAGEGRGGAGGTAGSGDGEAGAADSIEPVTIRVDPIITGWTAERPPATDGSSGGTGGSGADGSPGSPLAVDSGTKDGTSGSGPAAELARRLRSQLVLLFGVPPGGLSVEVWP
jgi:stage III sporulation protein AF